MTDLSVIVINWNTRDLVCECLDALIAAAHECRSPEGLRTEVFVVDNGSRDGSVEVLRAREPEIELIELPTNRGFASAANLALRRARGRFILLLNTDARLLDGAIERCLGVFESDPEVGVVGLQLLHADGRLQNSIHRFPSLLGELAPTWFLEILLPRHFPSKRRVRAELRDVDAVLGAALFARGDAVRDVGPLCEEYFFFLEETDWCWRMHEAGWRVVQMPDARAIHLSGASSKRRDPAATRIEYHRSLDLFLRRRRGSVTARVVVIVRALKTLLLLLWLAPAALFSQRERRRLRERGRLAAWYARGCPPGWGLAGCDVQQWVSGKDTG